MAYIIENAQILKDRQLKTCSFLIQEDRIAAIQSNFKRSSLMKMNLGQFIMTPTYILLNSNISQHESFPKLKQLITNQFLLKGCTTFLTYVTLNYEYELHSKVSEMETSLNSSPIDFLIGVRIPVRMITQSFIRSCKKKKIPAIFVEVQDATELANIPWSWIKDAMFPFNSPLIPIISCSEKKEVKLVLSKWKEVMVNEKIPAILEEIEENQPLSTAILNKIGIYPYKGSLMNGTELSYNLYDHSIQIGKVEQADLFQYHKDRLTVTVHRGKIIRSGKVVSFKPGYGEHVKVKTPSYFSI
ncbi:hypothetical protein [Neobacillus dielmonensis]|uniref:hypothetical protein n=1 Tax=Neobacillus dielmonensis TaxID=1347369 RepID=UPI0005AA2E00|nr:hypothetical protein [Neobacillus dielmonensis]